MSALFRRYSTRPCYFCNAPCPSVRNTRSFRCTSCGCLNRYNENGEIFSDEPAMHVESLNSGSFSKRGSAGHDRLPTMYGKGPFCQTCQSNQLILINLLSNYLPSPEDPEYASRLQMLPQYQESLHLRYPPVCQNCLPAVEEEIQRKDHMARTKALGELLTQSKGKEVQRRVPSNKYKDNEHLSKEIILWRARGVLWVTTFLMVNLANVSAILAYHPLRFLSFLQPILPLLVAVSLLWTCWDPSYGAIQRAKQQGRDVRAKGKSLYNIMQITAWLSRLSTSMFLAFDYFYSNNVHSPTSASSTSRSYFIYFSSVSCIELTALIISSWAIRLHSAPAIRLIQTNSHKLMNPSRSQSPTASGSRSSTPALPNIPESDSFASLSLSSKPVISPANPVFGLPSLLSNAPPPQAPPVRGVDEMDWSPSEPQKVPNVANESWIRPQRFFAPEQPTGLEGLFERALMVDDSRSSGSLKQHKSDRVFRHLQTWCWLYILALAPVVGISYKIWGRVHVILIPASS